MQLSSTRLLALQTLSILLRVALLFGLSPETEAHHASVLSLQGKLQRVEKPLVAESSRWGIYRLSSLSQTGCSASCLSEVAETSTWNSGRTWQLRGTGRRLLCLAHTPQWFVSVLPITPATGQTRPLPHVQKPWARWIWQLQHILPTGHRAHTQVLRLSGS